MKPLLIIYFTILLSLKIATFVRGGSPFEDNNSDEKPKRSIPPVCPFPTDEVAYFPFPGDRTKYYECWQGLKYVYQCPEGLWWNQEINECDYPENINCQISRVGFLQDMNNATTSAASGASTGSTGSGGSTTTGTGTTTTATTSKPKKRFIQSRLKRLADELTKDVLLAKIQGIISHNSDDEQLR